MHACPALRPWWCPKNSPSRSQDCCLPATGNRRLCLDTTLRTISLTTTLHISGLNHAAYILVPSSFALPLLGLHVDFTPDLLARLWSGGTCTSHGAHPLGHNNPFHGIAPNSKVSGLPWHDQRLVRYSRWSRDSPTAPSSHCCLRLHSVAPLSPQDT